MKHAVKHNQLARNTKQAKALYRGLIQSLLDKGRIETTQAKAKSVIGQVDSVINLVKENSINSRRRLVQILGSDKIVDSFFAKISGKMDDRNSGYSRIIKLGKRNSDAAEMVFLELVNYEQITQMPAVIGKPEPKTAKPEVKQLKVVEEKKPAKTKKPAVKKQAAKKTIKNK